MAVDGKKNGKSLLTELSPIPAKDLTKSGSWLAFFKNVEKEAETLVNKRRECLQSLIAEHKPPFVFCHGAERETAIEKFKALLPGRDWQPIGERSQISRLPNSVAVLMPFFGVGRLSTTEFNAVMEDLENLSRRHGQASVQGSRHSGVGNGRGQGIAVDT